MTLYGMNDHSIPSRSNDELAPLIGKTVTIYRGGPESKTGKLLDVQSDYLSLMDGSSVIYYALHHVQSITENAKQNSIPSVSDLANPSDTEIPAGFSCFHELLQHLVDAYIQVNQGGPESKQGTLLGVNDDHIVLFTRDDGVVFYHLQHIKSISLPIKREETAPEAGSSANEAVDNVSPSSADDVSPSPEDTSTHQETLSPPPYVNAQNLSDLLAHLTHTWVAINRGGPEAIEGILVPGGSGYYTIVNGNEIIRVHPHHIKSISCGPKGAFQAVTAGERQGDGENQGEQKQQEPQASHQEKKGEKEDEQHKKEKEKKKKGEEKAKDDKKTDSAETKEEKSEKEKKGKEENHKIKKHEEDKNKEKKGDPHEKSKKKDEEKPKKEDQNHKHD
ncbi:spore coat protein CotH [Geobacillus sp. BMUD]|uniref:hypothetical protein n=1 Tax=Geobacillus TaxID=129337 RepID=UPI00069218C8|nr:MULTISPECIES: hypothetical protein [Geobacillus]NNU84549.1 spore coat protein CotH [Geobacillus sp. BMUD]